MITVDFVFNLIENIVKRFEDEDEHCVLKHYYDTSGFGEGIDFFLHDEIKTALDCLNIKHRIDEVCVYEDKEWAFDAYATCVSFVVNEKVYRKFFIACEC